MRSAPADSFTTRFPPDPDQNVFPLRDDNPTATLPVMTVLLIAATVYVWWWVQGGGLSQTTLMESICRYGAIPVEVTGRALDVSDGPCPTGGLTWEAVLTSIFLHGGWMHLIGNMWFLWIFGNNVEDAMGHVRFVAFYLLCGIAAALAQIAADPASTIPMVGASGAIGGVLGAYLVLHPQARVLVLIPLGFFTRLIYVPAFLVLGLWFVLQFLSAPMTQQGGGVAYWAHIGGFVAGTALIFPFRRRGVVLFDRGQPRHVPRFRAERRRGPWG